jgi:hypothetical protein
MLGAYGPPPGLDDLVWNAEAARRLRDCGASRSGPEASAVEELAEAGAALIYLPGQVDSHERRWVDLST